MFTDRPDAGVGEIHGKAAEIPYGGVQLYANMPPGEHYEETGLVIAFFEKSIPGVTTHVLAPWRYATVPKRDDGVQEEDDWYLAARLVPEEGEGSGLRSDSELQRALQTRAAEVGADALVLRNGGIDQSGRLWASGLALRRR